MSTLRAAVSYCARGWPVLPLWPLRDGRCACRDAGACDWPGKHPACAGGVTAATLDVMRVVRFWGAFEARHGAAPHVGVATGGGLLVVDLDARHFGDETWRRLVDGRAPVETVESLTGNGRHLWFSLEGLGRVPSSVGRLGPGVDVRASGGYVVAPPSAHVSGRAYLWEASSDPTEGVALARAPSWLVELARVPAPRGAAARVAPGDVIAQGGRNDALARYACSLRARGVEELELREAVERLNATACDPPLSAREVGRIVRGVVRRYRAGLSPRVLAAMLASERQALHSERAQGRYDFKSDPAWWAASTGGEVPADPETRCDRG